jgi:hypothetical protein
MRFPFGGRDADERHVGAQPVSRNLSTLRPLGQSGVDVAARVDADAVDMAALHAGEHRPVRIANTDIGGLAVVFLLGDVEIAVLAARDVVRAAHSDPLAEEVAVGREDLDALVRPVGDKRRAESM